MEGYKVEIVEVSRELTAKERVKIKDTSDAIKLDTATEDGALLIDVDMYAKLSVYNEHSKDSKEYGIYLVIDKSGTKYVTGSDSFWTSFVDIVSEMSGTDEEYQIKIYKLPSKNFSGKGFITCSIE